MWADAAEAVAAVLAAIWLTVLVRTILTRVGRPRETQASSGPRTTVLVGAGTAVGLFGAHALLADFVLDAGGGPTAFDAAVWTFAGTQRAPAVTALAQLLDQATGVVALGVLSIVVAIALIARGYWREATVLLVAQVIGDTLAFVSKTVYERPRPPVAGRLIDEHGYSLPSGHATGTTVVFGVLVVVSWLLLSGRPALSRRSARAGLAGTAIIVASAVGASRVYLGVHWVSDILAGWLLGGAWVAVCATLLMLWRTRTAPRAPRADGAHALAGQGASSR